MDKFKDNILDGVVYSFHFQGFPATTAHEKLKEMTDGEVYTLDKVKDLYRRIDKKMFDLKKQDLSKFPEHVLQNVIENLGWRERSALRKTCKSLRSLVDATKFRINLLYILVIPDSVSIEIDHHVADYKRHPRMHSVSFDQSQRQFRIAHVYKTSMNDLRTILMNPKLQIEMLCLRTSARLMYFENSMFEAFSLNHPLHIEHFSCEGRDWATWFQRLFQTLNPEVLHSISAHKIGYGSLLSDELCVTPQWLKAKRFESIGCSFESHHFNCLTHFEKAYLTDARSQISFEGVMDLKNRLLTNPHLDQLKISFHFANNTELIEAFLRLKNDDDSQWIHFHYPDSQLKLSLRVTRAYIWFKGPCYVEDGDDEDVRRMARILGLEQRRVQ